MNLELEIKVITLKKIIPVPNLLSGVQTMWKKNNVER